MKPVVGLLLLATQQKSLAGSYANDNCTSSITAVPFPTRKRMLMLSPERFSKAGPRGIGLTLVTTCRLAFIKYLCRRRHWMGQTMLNSDGATKIRRERAHGLHTRCSVQMEKEN